MSLTDKQKALIAEVDAKARKFFNANSDEETLLVEMLPHMADIKSMMDTVPKKDIEMYFYEYEGFYRYMKVLEDLARRIQQGKISVP